MGALEQLKDMVEAAKAQAAKLETLQSEVEKLSQASGQDDLKNKVEALVKERDALRKAIQAEIDDKDADTKRLEAAIGPVQEAPVPEIVKEETKAEEPKADEPKPEDSVIQPLPGA